jgi:hypothetical protein
VASYLTELEVGGEGVEFLLFDDARLLLRPHLLRHQHRLFLLAIEAQPPGKNEGGNEGETGGSQMEHRIPSEGFRASRFRDGRL